MTTIVYRNGVLAADTACFAGDCRVGDIVKIVRRGDGDMAGAAGDAAYNAAFLDWFVGGEELEPPKATQSDAHLDRGVIFRRNGEIVVFEPNGRFIITAEYYALGSGRSEALGALFAGADPAEAVRAAIYHDPHTDGPITVLCHET